MYATKVIIALATLSATFAAPLSQRQAANDVSPVTACKVAQLTPAIASLQQFASQIQASQGSAFGEDPFVFLTAGQKVLPTIISDLATAASAAKAGDLKTTNTHTHTRRFVFLTAGQKVLPTIISDLATAASAAKAGDLKTVLSSITDVQTKFDSVPLDFTDGEVSVADENIASITGDIVKACAGQ
uniref:Uncharacterized protein n=1 Tax=Mycena chlorophos TaxID=658473 RepID=A0ABQ0L2T4_MYCCL|nr:predicted protein [Mycena chlorophos]